VPQRLRIFISSPSDVNPERRRAALVIEKVAKDYARFFDVTPVLWESEPMLASGHFQDAIVPPSESDIVVLILWSRLGTPLPERTEVREYRGLDGRAPVTGTEWEFEDALRASKQKGLPDLLAYRKKAAPKAEYQSAADLEELGRQLQSLESFWSRYFVGRGEFRAAFSEFAELDAFELKLEADLRSLIERRVGQVGDVQTTSAAVWLRGSPFRGLETYRFEHAPIFFGRGAATQAAVERLVENADAGRPFLLVLGASGAGKSSLAQAGIVPGLCARGVVSGVGEWRRAVVRPGGHPEGPFAALATALAADDALPELVAEQGSASLARHLQAAAADPAFPIVSALTARERRARQQGALLSHEQARLAVVVDQMEELFTLGELTSDERNDFVRCLDGLMRSGRVFVVATMRSDYWHRAAEVPRLAELSDGNGRFDLLPPTQAEIAEMIRRPAEASGLAFETDRRTDIRLDAALAEEAAHEPGALPLVSFLLDALFLLDVKEAGRATLGYASMQALGGLKGAIATRAEAAFSALPEEAQAALPKVLRALARVSRSGADPTARTAPMARFTMSGPERKIIDALLAPDVRLLVAEGDGQGARIRFAHEALISHWARAKQQIAQDRDDLRTLTAIEEAEAEWRSADAHQRRGYLLHDVKLANAVDLVQRWADDLPGEVRGFVARSAAVAAAAARRRWAAAAVVMVLLAALAAASLAGLYIAEIQRNDALIAESHSLARDARAATASGDATLAKLLALAALPKDLAKPDRPFVNEAEYALEEAVANQRERVVLPARERRILTARFAPDGTAQAVVSRIDHAVELWNASTGAPIVVLLGHADGINSATFSSDGMRLLTSSRDHTARLWDVETGAQITVFRGHDDAVEQASFSPDGMQVITASHDQTARIWKSDSGAMVAVLRGHEYRLSSAFFSPDGTRVATAAIENARLWDAATGDQIAVLDEYPSRIAFSPDGGRIALSTHRGASLRDARTGEKLAALDGPTSFVVSIDFSRDGTRLVTAALDGIARLWDGVTGAAVAVLRGHKDSLRSAAFSSDGSMVVTTSSDASARLWDAQTGAEIAILRGHVGAVDFAQLSPDGARLITTSTDQTIRLWDVGINAAVAVLRGHAGAVQAAAFSPDGTRIVTASADTTARLWDARSGAEISVLRGHTGLVWSAVFSPDGARVLTGSGDRTARLWDAGTGSEIVVFQGHTHQVAAAVFSPDGRRVLTASMDRVAALWDVKTGAAIAALRGDNDGFTRAAVYSPDGMRVATAFSTKARLWDADGRAIAVLEGHSFWVRSIAFSPDSTRIVTGAGDNTGRIWDALTGAPAAQLLGHTAGLTSVAFSPDGARVVTAAGDKTARVWDGTNGTPAAVLRGHESDVASAVFSPDGARVLTASRDTTARLWDVRTGAEIAVLRGHKEPLHSAAFSPDGRFAVTASDDKTARLWKLPPRCQTLIDTAWQENVRDLSPAERARYFLQDQRKDLLAHAYAAIRPWLGSVLPRAGDVCQ
jgi:WD40 repeat protein